jgi:hypothetical protein
MGDGNRPPRSHGPFTGDTDISAGVDQRAAGAELEQLSADEISGESFPDSARVEADVGRKLDTPAVDRNRGAARVELALRSGHRRQACDLRKRPVVSGPKQRTEHGRVKQPAGPAPAFKRTSNEIHRLSGDRDERSGCSVESVDLAFGSEPTPASLEVGEASRRMGSDALSTADDDVDRAAHRLETKLSCHRSSLSQTCPGWRA